MNTPTTTTSPPALAAAFARQLARLDARIELYADLQAIAHAEGRTDDYAPQIAEYRVGRDALLALRDRVGGPPTISTPDVLREAVVREIVRLDAKIEEERDQRTIYDQDDKKLRWLEELRDRLLARQGQLAASPTAAA